MIHRNHRPPGPGNMRRCWQTSYNSDGTQHAYECWYAWIRVAPGKLQSTTYGIKRWGVAGAKAKARQWLAQKLEVQRKNYEKLGWVYDD